MFPANEKTSVSFGDFLRMERLPFLRSLFRWGPTSLANGDRRGKHTLGDDKEHDTKHNKKWGLKRTTWKMHSTTVRPSDSVPIAMRDSEKRKHCSLLSLLGALESCHPMKISDASLYFVFVVGSCQAVYGWHSHVWRVTPQKNMKHHHQNMWEWARSTYTYNYIQL